MKKILLLLLIHFSAMAQPVYCPTEIICAQSNDLSSCHFEQSPQRYWDRIINKQNITGVYKNTYVSAPYYSYDQGVALCVYTHEQSYKTLTLRAKPESNLEIIQNNDWRSEETWWECRPEQHNACPLQEQAALTIQNKTMNTLFLSNGFSITPGQFMRLYDNDFLKDLIDIYDENNFIGRIKIDINDRLKIMDIILGDSDLQEIYQIEEFNAVVVE